MAIFFHLGYFDTFPVLTLTAHCCIPSYSGKAPIASQAIAIALILSQHGRRRVEHVAAKCLLAESLIVFGIENEFMP